ncbi:four helix bundle protein [Daejeonella lutea]|uniref:Four helix bundle protein n=1 Tax=Daejeonella lutea TaxID=572036 RepID=A0A1T5A8L8_9SPHI|nr:four helix bundle protein [Daejeonella lutea]SKB31268.1 four helix bundle protein [Daejeonella lutea]
MPDFNSLAIWQLSHTLTLKIYSVSHDFPKQEIYGLTSQIRRSCSSIPTNIAEGCGRSSNVEMRRFLIISSGSASELHYQLILAKDLNYISEPLYKELCAQLLNIRRMISAFIKNIPIR